MCAQEAHHNSKADEYMNYKYLILADIEMDHRAGKRAPLPLPHAPKPQ